ncbi:hypothetical protein HHI36_000578 [Cryptolaemus montrouzieri]|uniref:CHK kinase-like domain-containing protein n=1 Tax=Cryptolaemus montrouzieri TaxID=559131 RepID=A0ABD2P5E7_9CUCU
MAAIMRRGSCNAEALKQVICKFAKKNVDVSNPLPEPATARGNNFVSDAWRIGYLVSENGKVHQDSVIVKARPENEAQNALMHTDIAFKNEILAYEEVIPTLNKYVCAPMRVPKYIHGDPSTVVLEDMSNSGFESANKKLATEWNLVWSPIQEMAKLHAASITMQHLDKANFDSLKNKIIEVPLPESTPLGDKQATVLDTILGVLGERKEAEKYTKLIEELKKDAWREQKEIVQKDVPIRVINHGSLWVNNTLYRGDLITILDLQHIVYSTPATDLSFFLYVNLEPEFLSNNRKSILEYYLLNLHQNITDKLGCIESKDVVVPLNYGWIDQELRRCSLYAYMMAQWIMPVLYWSDAVYNQLENIGGLENLAIPQRLSYLTPEQKDRIIKLTKLFAAESSKY